MTNKIIGIIGAMECEIAELKKSLSDIQILKFGFVQIYKGKIAENAVILVQSGVGKVNAAMCTQLIIDNFHPDFIINTGVAGGIADNLEIGDIIVGKELVQYDFDVTALGYAKGYMCTGHDKDKPTVYRSDDKLIFDFEKVIGKKLPEIHLHKGIIATGDKFIGDNITKKEIKEYFGATGAEMEGAAVCQCTGLNNVPCIIIRSVSDLADGSKTESQDEFERKTAKISSKVVKIFIESI